MAKAKSKACRLSGESGRMSVWQFSQRERRVPRVWTELGQESRRGLKVRQAGSFYLEV